MSGPYRVRIVQLDGVARYLGALNGRAILRDNGTGYKTIASARRAGKKYLAGHFPKGGVYADICDDNNEERRIDL